MLNSTNYTVWAMRMKIALKVNKVWETIDPANKVEEKNDIAIALVFQSIHEALTLQVGDLDTAKGVWDAIKARHVGAERVREARLQTLIAEFDKLKMKEGDTIDVFVGKLSEISSKSASLGEIIEESKHVKKFLKSLPRKRYIHIIASLEQVLDLNTTSFEDIIGRLKAYEERIKEDEDEQTDDQKKLMYANWRHNKKTMVEKAEAARITTAAEAGATVDDLPGGVGGVVVSDRINMDLINRIEMPRISHVTVVIRLVTLSQIALTGYLNFKEPFRRKKNTLKKPMN